VAAEPPLCNAAALPTPLYLPRRTSSETKQSLPHMKSLEGCGRFCCISVRGPTKCFLSSARSVLLPVAQLVGQSTPGAVGHVTGAVGLLLPHTCLRLEVPSVL